MKFPNHPILCGTALAVMFTAGISHWWSVRQFVAVIERELPISTPKSAPAAIATAPKKELVPSPGLLAAQISPQVPAPTPQPEGGQKQFYEALITRMQSLQNQNRDLLDQLAETNRDLMKLEFRVDTHSESFRPLPTTEDRPDTSFGIDTGLGVLPPRAEPVDILESQ